MRHTLNEPIRDVKKAYRTPPSLSEFHGIRFLLDVPLFREQQLWYAFDIRLPLFPRPIPRPFCRFSVVIVVVKPSSSSPSPSSA